MRIPRGSGGFIPLNFHIQSAGLTLWSHAPVTAPDDPRLLSSVLPGKFFYETFQLVCQLCEKLFNR